MYYSISKNDASTKALQGGLALIAAILLTGVLILSLSKQAHASPTEQDVEYTKQITGQVTWEDGSPAEGIRIDASGQRHGWHEAYSNASGHYTLTLPADTWQISIDTLVQYDLERGDLAFQSMAAVLILQSRWYGAELPYTAQFTDDSSNEMQVFDIEARRVNSKITGTLRGSDGTPITGLGNDGLYLYAYSEEYDAYRTFVQVDTNGVYTVSVASGSWTLNDGFRSGDSAPDVPQMGHTELASITVDANSVVQQDLVFEEYDATISGLILRTDTNEPILDGSVTLSNAANEGIIELWTWVSMGDSEYPFAAEQHGTLMLGGGRIFGPVIYPVSWDGVVEVAAAGETVITIGGIDEMDEAAFLPVVIR